MPFMGDITRGIYGVWQAQTHIPAYLQRGFAYWKHRFTLCCLYTLCTHERQATSHTCTLKTTWPCTVLNVVTVHKRPWPHQVRLRMAVSETQDILLYGCIGVEEEFSISDRRDPPSTIGRCVTARTPAHDGTSGRHYGDLGYYKSLLRTGCS